MTFLARAAIILATVAFTAAPASARTLEYTLSGNDVDGTVEFASFRVDEHPIILPNNVGPGEGFRIKFLAGAFQYGATISALQDIEFQNAAIGGGFLNLDPTDHTGASTFLFVTGPQLYSGFEAAPTLLTGAFTVNDAFSGAPLALSVAAVPEPATWAMLLTGLGATGLAVRRRERAAVLGA